MDQWDIYEMDLREREDREIRRSMHIKRYREALHRYGSHDRYRHIDEEVLLYCITAIGDNYERFIDTDYWEKHHYLHINPDSLAGLSSMEFRLVQLGFNIYTGDSEYAVSEAEFFSFDNYFREVALNALRLTCRLEIEYLY